MEREQRHRSGPVGPQRWRTESIGRFQLGALVVLIAAGTTLRVLWTLTSIDRRVLLVTGVVFVGGFFVTTIEVMSRATGLSRRQAIIAPFRRAQDERQ